MTEYYAPHAAPPQKKVRTIENVGDFEDLLFEFSHFSEEFIGSMWDAQSQNYAACHDILRGLPFDHEVSTPAWLQDNYDDEMGMGNDVDVGSEFIEETNIVSSSSSSMAGDGNRMNYKVALLQKSVPKGDEDLPMDSGAESYSKEKPVWRPRIIVAEDKVVATKAAVDEYDDDMAEYMWHICADSGRDASRATYSAAKKAAGLPSSAGNKRLAKIAFQSHK